MLKIKARFKFLCWVVLACFSFSSSGFTAPAAVPVVNQGLGIAKPAGSAMLRGVKIDPNNPLKIEFMIEAQAGKTVTKEEFDRLVGYFMATLTIPEKDFWVNLSPYEKERVIDSDVAQTEFGKGLLVEDYILKQLASGLTNPQTDAGKDYWKAINTPLATPGGSSTTASPGVNTPAQLSLTKVWIMPDKAEIFENGNIAYVTQANYKVLTDEDFLAQQQNNYKLQITNSKLSNAAIESFKKNILPKIEADVNGGENFIQLRQMLSSFLLASWFKNKLKDSLYKYYINQNKVKGIDKAEKDIKEKIYNQYAQAFKQGAYNYIQKERVQNKVISRQYFSGGVTGFDKVAVGVPDSRANVINKLPVGDWDLGAAVADAGMFMGNDGERKSTPPGFLREDDTDVNNGSSGAAKQAGTDYVPLYKARLQSLIDANPVIYTNINKLLNLRGEYGNFRADGANIYQAIKNLQENGRFKTGIGIVMDDYGFLLPNEYSRWVVTNRLNNGQPFIVLKRGLSLENIQWALGHDMGEHYLYSSYYELFSEYAREYDLTVDEVAHMIQAGEDVIDFIDKKNTGIMPEHEAMLDNHIKDPAYYVKILGDDRGKQNDIMRQWVEHSTRDVRWRKSKMRHYEEYKLRFKKEARERLIRTLGWDNLSDSTFHDFTFDYITDREELSGVLGDVLSPYLYGEKKLDDLISESSVLSRKDEQSLEEAKILLIAARVTVAARMRPESIPIIEAYLKGGEAYIMLNQLAALAGGNRVIAKAILDYAKGMLDGTVADGISGADKVAGKNDASVMGEGSMPTTVIDQVRGRSNHARLDRHNVFSPAHGDDSGFPNIFGGRGRGIAASVVIGIATVNCGGSSPSDNSGVSGAATTSDGSAVGAAGSENSTILAQGGTSGAPAGVITAGTAAMPANGGAVISNGGASVVTGGSSSISANLDPASVDYKTVVTPVIKDILTEAKGLRAIFDNTNLSSSTVGTPYTADGLLLLTQTVSQYGYSDAQVSEVLKSVNGAYSPLVRWLGDYATAVSLILEAAKRANKTFLEAAAAVDAIRTNISSTYMGQDGYAIALAATIMKKSYSQFAADIVETYYQDDTVTVAYYVLLANELGVDILDTAKGMANRANISNRLTRAKDALGAGATSQAAYDYVLAQNAGSQNPISESAKLADYYLADNLAGVIPYSTSEAVFTAPQNRFKLVTITRTLANSTAASGAARAAGSDFVPLDKAKLQGLLKSNPAILTDFKSVIQGQDKDTLGDATKVVSEALKELFEKGIVMADMLPIVMDDGQFLGHNEDSRWVVDPKGQFNGGKPFVVLRKNLSRANALWALGHDFGEYQLFNNNKELFKKYGKTYNMSAEQVAHIIQSAIEAVENVRSRSKTLIYMHGAMFRDNNGAIGFFRDLIKDNRAKQNHLVRMWADHQNDDSFVEDYKEYQQKFKKTAENCLLHSLELATKESYRKEVIDYFFYEQNFDGNQRGIIYFLKHGMEMGGAVRVLSELKKIDASQATARLIAVRMAMLYSLDYNLIANIEEYLNNKTTVASEKDTIDMGVIKAHAKEIMDDHTRYAASGTAKDAGTDYLPLIETRLQKLFDAESKIADIQGTEMYTFKEYGNLSTDKKVVCDAFNLVRRKGPLYREFSIVMDDWGFLEYGEYSRWVATPKLHGGKPFIVLKRGLDQEAVAWALNHDMGAMGLYDSYYDRLAKYAQDYGITVAQVADIIQTGLEITDFVRLREPTLMPLHMRMLSRHSGEIAYFERILNDNRGMQQDILRRWLIERVDPALHFDYDRTYNRSQIDSVMEEYVAYQRLFKKEVQARLERMTAASGAAREAGTEKSDIDISEKLSEFIYSDPEVIDLGQEGSLISAIGLAQMEKENIAEAVDMLKRSGYDLKGTLPVIIDRGDILPGNEWSRWVESTSMFAGSRNYILLRPGLTPAQIAWALSHDNGEFRGYFQHKGHGYRDLADRYRITSADVAHIIQSAREADQFIRSGALGLIEAHRIMLESNNDDARYLLDIINDRRSMQESIVGIWLGKGVLHNYKAYQQRFKEAAASYGGIKMETNITIKSGSKLIEIKVTPQMVAMMQSAKRVGYEVVSLGTQKPLKEALGL